MSCRGSPVLRAAYSVSPHPRCTPKTFGKSKFTGDPEACAKLNANSGLVKLANNFARTESKVGGGTLKRERLFKIVPDATARCC